MSEGVYVAHNNTNSTSRPQAALNSTDSVSLFSDCRRVLCGTFYCCELLGDDSAIIMMTMAIIHTVDVVILMAF
jgi:hypothetical protein